MFEHQPRKRFGQNFLSDTNMIHKIIAAINPRRGQAMVEIGPGLGALTGPVLSACGELQVVELDRDLIPVLAERVSKHGKLIIHQADALTFDFAALSQPAQKLRIIGNLPYNISTPLLFHLLRFASHIDDMHFMLQKEVVERLIATPGNKDYGRLSIMIQYYCEAEGLFVVPPYVFHPVPKVDSMIVRLRPYRNLPHQAEDVTILADLVKQAFSQRRKTIGNTLKPYFSKLELTRLNIDPQLRPENLDLPAYVKLANAVLEFRK